MSAIRFPMSLCKNSRSDHKDKCLTWPSGSGCSAASASLIGIAKTGAPGIATLTVPLMVMTVGDARHAAAWTAPILITGDIFAVAYWRRQAGNTRSSHSFHGLRRA